MVVFSKKPAGIRKKYYCVHDYTLRRVLKKDLAETNVLHILHHTHPPDPLPLTIVQWCVILSRSAISIVVVVIMAMVVATAAVAPSSPAAPPDRWLHCRRRHCSPPQKVVKTTLCTTVRAKLPPKYPGF